MKDERKVDLRVLGESKLDLIDKCRMLGQDQKKENEDILGGRKKLYGMPDSMPEYGMKKWAKNVNENCQKKAFCQVSEESDLSKLLIMNKLENAFILARYLLI
ncbi:MAG: hypothetical protein ACP5J6_11375 [Candidatus Saccharicenans sp.]